MAKAKIKSLQQQMQEAVDSGNLEMAREVVKAMQLENERVKLTTKKQTKTKKPKTVTNQDTGKQVKIKKVKPKTKPKKKLVIPTEDEIVDLTEEKPRKTSNVEIVDLTHIQGGREDDDEDDETADLTGKNRGADGTPCRIESIVGRKRKNTFHDDGTLEQQDSPKHNKALAKMYAPANKVRKSRQPRKVQKARVKCGCGKIDIIPIELAPNAAFEEVYRCGKCAGSRRKE